MYKYLLLYDKPKKQRKNIMNNKFDILEVATRLGVSVVRNKALCPFHNDTHPSLTFRGGYYRCWACGAKGDSVDLVRRLTHCSYTEATSWIEGNSIAKYTHTSTPPAWKQPAADLRRYEDIFRNPIITKEARMFLSDQRRLDPKVLSDLRISSNHTHIAIPYFGTDGRSLLSVQWRYLGCDKAVPRFTFARGSSPGIYNLPILNGLQPTESLYIAEGTSDCWALLSAGCKAIAIPSATLLRSCRREHISIIRRHPRLHMYPDNDLAGESLYNELKQQLPQLVKHSLPTGCKDFADFYKQCER